jgi:hypothetical protein
MRALADEVRDQTRPTAPPSSPPLLLRRPPRRSVPLQQRWFSTPRWRNGHPHGSAYTRGKCASVTTARQASALTLGPQPQQKYGDLAPASSTACTACYATSSPAEHLSTCPRPRPPSATHRPDPHRHHPRRRDLLTDLRRIDTRLRDNTAHTRDALASSTSTLTDNHGLRVLLAAKILGHVGHITRFPSQDHFASYTATAPLTPPAATSNATDSTPAATGTSAPPCTPSPCAMPATRTRPRLPPSCPRPRLPHETASAQALGREPADPALRLRYAPTREQAGRSPRAGLEWPLVGVGGGDPVQERLRPQFRLDRVRQHVPVRGSQQIEVLQLGGGVLQRVASTADNPRPSTPQRARFG